MKNVPSMNLVLLRSIPLDRHLKRYYISKYKHLCKSNGLDFANAKFKQLSSALKHYKAVGTLPSTGFRNNGWMKKLINYVDSQPHFAFNFLKGLTSWKGEIDVDVVSTDFDKKLRSIESNYPTPSFMKEWTKVLGLTNMETRRYYTNPLQRVSTYFKRYMDHHSISEWSQYWREWRKVFNKDHQPSNLKRDRPVFPEQYKDVHFPKNGNGSFSQSYEKDLVDVLTILQINTDLSEVSTSHVLSYLSEDVRDRYYAMMMEEWMPNYKCTDFMSGNYVGAIHYIPKSGTNYRPIAVPNRFLQSALVPIYERLKNSVGKLKTDATFNQDAFDNWIQSRVTTKGRFIGSVDLSAATENLPLEWCEPILDYLELSPEEISSLTLFREMSRARWDNDGYMSKWNVGQPLGSLPSFMVLSLTHNLFCEALSLKEGYGHSPYRILGDDIVISSKRLYGAYIREMSNRKIPLSHSKSFHGKLTEFAGKTYIRNNIPFLTPDHSAITWESLFDFQYATGIRVPWNLVPKAYRNRITRRAKGLTMSGQSLYDWAQQCCVYDRGSSHTTLRGGTTLENYFSLSSDTLTPEAIDHTGRTRFQRGTIIANAMKTPTDDDKFRRFIQTSLPEWFKSKYRPTTTDSVFSSTITALQESKVIST